MLENMDKSQNFSCSAKIPAFLVLSFPVEPSFVMNIFPTGLLWTRWLDRLRTAIAQTPSTIYNHCPFMGSLRMHNWLYIKHSYELSLWWEGVVKIEIIHFQMCVLVY